MPSVIQQTLSPYAQVTGSAPTGESAFGSTPQLPSLQSTQRQAIGGNMTNLGALYGLAGNINQFQNQQAPLGLQENLPGYQNLLGQSSQNTQSLLQGQIPQDVINQLTQQAAERGVAMGSPGSPNANTALLSALGQTSLGLEQQGLQNFQTLAGMTPQVQPMDLSPYMVTPAQQQDVASSQAIYNAAPNPAAAAQANLGAAQAGIGAGRAMGPAVPPAPSVPGLPTSTGVSGNPQGGTTYGGVVYPAGSAPTAGGTRYAGGTPGGNLFGQGGSLTGNPWLDSMYGGGSTGDPFMDMFAGSQQGGFYAGGAAGGPADTSGQGGGYTYMGNQGGATAPWDDLSALLGSEDPSMMGYDPMSGLYSDTGESVGAAAPAYDPSDYYSDTGP